MWAALATVVLWSGNTVVTKAASGLISPGSISFYRWALAFLVLLPLVGRGAWRTRAIAAPHWWQMAIQGALGMVLYQCLAYAAASTTTAVNMGVIVALMPLMSILLAGAIAGEPLTARKIGGGIISLSGLVYLTSRGNPASLIHDGVHPGDAMMLLATFANSLYGVMLKRWPVPVPLWHQLLWQMGFSILMLLPVWLLGDISPITAANLPLVLYAAIGASLLAPACWLIGVKRAGAARAALLVNLLPIIVAALAAVLLHEQLHLYHAIGGGLALLGVALGLREPKGSLRKAAA